MEEGPFYIEPKRDCPHIVQITADPENIGKNTPCEDCQHEVENWVCLCCSKRFCSRYVKGHMADHNAATSHPITASYSDLSFWCYSCESYITHPILNHYINSLSKHKFGDAGTGGRFTAHVNKEQMEETEESPEITATKIQELAQYIKDSKHMIAFTGAGISTSAGVPDFRGPQGAWTLAAMKQVRTVPTTPMLSAMPTDCHMSLVALQNTGKLKYLVSQNVDGLHRRSGISPKILSELHGNTNLEVCEKCGAEYLRDFDTCRVGHGQFHRTGRYCSIPECDGQLKDTIISFGESLPLHAVNRGFEESEKADLCICVGSSLTVTPAADMPKLVGRKKGAKLVIINLQKTPLDKLADIRIFAKSDLVFREVMKILNLDIPTFQLERNIRIKQSKNSLKFYSRDSEGIPASIFKGIEITWINSNGNKINEETIKLDGDEGPLKTAIPKESNPAKAEIKVYFMEHYNEPTFSFNFNIKNSEKSVVEIRKVSYSPSVDSEWKEIQCSELDAADDKVCNSFYEDEVKYPKQLRDDRHDHTLVFVENVYNGAGFRCDNCLEVGKGHVYHCNKCSYDLHPGCAIWRRDDRNKPADKKRKLK